MATQSKTWLGKILAGIVTFFSKASDELHDLTILATNIVTALKNAEASDVGQFLETTLEMVFPASIGLINAFRLWLPKIAVDLQWVLAEEGKTDQQKVADAIAYLAKLKVNNPDAYAAQLNTLNGLIQKWLSDNRGAGLTIQQALVTPQVVYNPNMFAVAA